MATRGPISRMPQGQVAQQLNAARFPWWFPIEVAGRQLDAFTLVTDFEPISASATETQNIAVPGDAAFLILSAVAAVTNTDNTTFVAFGARPYLVTLRTTGSDRGLSNGAVHIDNWFGTAAQPAYWDNPKILAPNENLAVTLQNLAATDRNVRLAFRGFKVFGFRA